MNTTAPARSSPYSPPTPEQLALAKLVNAQLQDGRVDFYNMPDIGKYGAVFQTGSRRRTLVQDYPFEDVAELVDALKRWIAASRTGARYSYDPPDED